MSTINTKNPSQRTPPLLPPLHHVANNRAKPPPPPSNPPILPTWKNSKIELNTRIQMVLDMIREQRNRRPVPAFGKIIDTHFSKYQPTLHRSLPDTPLIILPAPFPEPKTPRKVTVSCKISTLDDVDFQCSVLSFYEYVNLSFVNKKTQ